LYRRSATNPDAWDLQYEFRSSAGLPRSQVGVEADLEASVLALRSANTVDLYDLASPTPRWVKSLPSSAYAGAAGGAANAVSLSGRVLALLDGASPQAHNEIWIRDETHPDEWTMVTKLTTKGYGPLTSGNQLFVANADEKDVPTYSGQVRVFEAAPGGESRDVALDPGEQARDIAFALVAQEGNTPRGDFHGDRSIDGADFVALQRGRGQTGGALQSEGDANDDGDVDFEDVGIWEAQYGDLTPPSVTAFGAAAADSAASAIGAELSQYSMMIDAAMTWKAMSAIRNDWRRDAADSSRNMFRSQDVAPVARLRLEATCSWEFLNAGPTKQTKQLYDAGSQKAFACDDQSNVKDETGPPDLLGDSDRPIWRQ
jgi:hypothetical protein